MFREVVLLLIFTISLLLLGLFTSITSFDYKIYEISQSFQSNSRSNSTTSFSKKPNFSDNIISKAIQVEIVMGGDKKLVYVDENTTELEVFAIMGGKVENILTISNYLKIIKTEQKIYLR